MTYMLFCIEDLVVNEVGRPHWRCRRIFARSWGEIEALCDLMGWRLDGEFVGEIPAGPELDAFCDSVVRERDEEWIRSQSSGRSKSE